jgi:hypothetical protein
LRLPNADRAIIEEAKLRLYFLSPTHPVGRFKAAYFANLGYTEANWRQLELDLRQQHLSQPAAPGQESPFGQKYEIRAALRGPLGRIAPIASIWIILAGEEVPRLVTLYPAP